MKRARDQLPLPAAKLRWRCAPESLGFRTTSDLRSRPEIIGQPRALSALKMGLEIRSPGFNIFVVGLTGTGKTTTIRHLLDELDVGGETPPDLCFVHDFDMPERPRPLRLPAGKGRRLRRTMRRCVDALRADLPRAFETEAYRNQHRRIVDSLRRESRQTIKKTEQEIAAQGFQLVQARSGDGVHPDLQPVIAGETLSMDTVQELTEDGRFERGDYEQLVARHERLTQLLQSVTDAGRAIEARLRQAIFDLDQKTARDILTELLHEPRGTWSEHPQALRHLDAVEKHVLETLAERLRRASGDEGSEDDGNLPPGPSPRQTSLYEVNLAVDNAEVKGRPVVIEESPTWKNLFGSIDYVPDAMGRWQSDYTRVQAGSLLRAHGGFLVFNLHDTAEDTAVWPALKRQLRNRKAEIRNNETRMMFPASLHPEPLDIDVKVVCIGDNWSYQALHGYDEEFRKIFKVKADFDSSMPRGRKSTRQYAHFVAQLARKEGLMPFDASGVASLLEVGARLAGRQNRLTTRFSEVADHIREAHYWAHREGAHHVRESHVDMAVRHRRERVNLPEDTVQRSIESGALLLDVRGTRSGQINALTVYDLGDHVFGRPTRITAEVSMGRSGIINIEREANLSGSTHDKGVLILAGYLRRQYAQTRPLTLSASLAFEQSYGGVDGDSASAAELFVLVSAIGRLPMRQDLAVTGSVNQKGELQPIGNVNEKIEGFYDVCMVRGLTGTQGVIMPIQNVGDLMLRKDVVHSVERGRFHVHAVRRVDQALELLTGVRAGRRTPSGYENNTIHGVVDRALQGLADEIKEYVEGSDSASGRPPTQGLADEEDDDGLELRRER